MEEGFKHLMRWDTMSELPPSTCSVTFNSAHSQVNAINSISSSSSSKQKDEAKTAPQ
jgi:hypothetical protein